MDYKIILFFLDNKYISFIICFPILFIHLINCFLENHYKSIKPIKPEAVKKKRNICDIYIIIIILIVLIISINIPILKHIINFANYSYMVYIFIIEPLFNKKLDYGFIEKNTSLSSFLLINLLYILSKVNYDYLKETFSNQIVLQISIVFTLFIIIFLTLYCFILNTRFISYYLSNSYFITFDKKLEKIINKLDKRFDFEIILDNKSKLYCSIIATKGLILFTIFQLITRSILFVIYFFIKKYINISKNINEINAYKISKASFIMAVFIVYIIIQISTCFNNSIIAIYEFVTSTLIIPIILETLIIKREK